MPLDLPSSVPMSSNKTRRDLKCQTRAVKRKVITSCVECYRRKQKCDRVQPCNFCSARGVPELCRYGVSSYVADPRNKSWQSLIATDRNNVLVRENTSTTFESLTGSTASITSTPPIDLIDQIGYSSASRCGELEEVGEYGSRSIWSTSEADQANSITDADIYSTLLSRLPSEQVTRALIDAHFSAENWSFPILDEHYFRALYKDFQSRVLAKFSYRADTRLPTTLTSFPALLFAVLAVTLQFTVPNSAEARALDISTTVQCIRLSQWYLDTGQRITRLFEQQKPTTTLIEFDLLKMSWMKNIGLGSEAWQSLGTALRQAQEIDLHRIEESPVQMSGSDIERTLTELWKLEHRKRLWMKIFIMDSHMSVALGRPRGVNREDCSTPVPIDCDYPREPSRAVPMSTNHHTQPPNTFSPIIFSIALSHKYHDLMSIRASKLDLKDYGRITSLHNEVESLLTELPPALRPYFPDTTWDREKPQLAVARLRLLTTANIFLLALHRPYLATHMASRTAAMEAALTISKAQQDLFALVPQSHHKLFGYSFYTIDTGIFVTAATLKHPASDMAMNVRVLQALQQACARLSCAEDRSSIARTGKVVLQRCCDLLEATVPSYPNTANSNYATQASQTMNPGILSFLRGSGFQMPDQATRDLMVLLDESSAPTTNFSASNMLLSNGMDQDITISPESDDFTGNSSLYTDLAPEDVSTWRC